MVQAAPDRSYPVAGDQQNKYPEVSLDGMRVGVARFLQVLGDNGRLNVEQIYHKLFRISR